MKCRLTIKDCKIMTIKEKVKEELRCYLLRCGMIDERMPECNDVEEKWEMIAQAYLPDGIREYNGFPTVSLGWIMFVGMAVAKLWDEDWQKYCNMKNLYESLRDVRGFDCMDDYINQDILKLSATDAETNEKTVSQCANRIYNMLRHEPLEAGTTEAFKAYLACIEEMYLMGMAVQLKRMGYHMTKVN